MLKYQGQIGEVVTDRAVRGNHPWLLIRYMPRGRGDMSNRFSAYARQFLGQMENPMLIISRIVAGYINRPETTSRNPRSGRRYGNRNIRLPEVAFCQDRHSPLPCLRQEITSKRWTRWLRVLELETGTRIQLFSARGKGKKRGIPQAD